MIKRPAAVLCDQVFLMENISTSSPGYLMKLLSVVYLGWLSKDNKRLPGYYIEQLSIVPS